MPAARVGVRCYAHHAHLGQAAVDVLLAHDVFHVPHFGKVKLELLAELRLARWQPVACHQLQQIPAQSSHSLQQTQVHWEMRDELSMHDSVNHVCKALMHTRCV